LIAWVVYGPWAQRTGGYVYDARVVEGLRALGERVEVFELGPTPSIAHALELPVRIARGQPDVIVGDELCFRELAAAFALRPPRRGPKRVMLVHHPAAWETPRPQVVARWLERGAMRAADLVVATSTETAARLQREKWTREVRVVEPGADRLPARPHRPFDPARTHLVFVGSVMARKRVLELLDAFDHDFAGTEATLSIVGSLSRDVPYAARVRTRVERSARLRAKVILRGEVGDEAVADALADADALVLPSALEGYGMILSEALFAGTPVIAARTGAAPRLVREGNDGLLADADELNTVLRDYFDSAELRARLLRGAAGRAVTLPRWADSAKKFLSHLSRTRDRAPLTG
jgi:glycosyltransferase involved in cell wall biosynthesis